MVYWRKYNNTYCAWPSSPKGIIEFIGGSYLCAKPQISYRNLFTLLHQQDYAIHSWSYLPGLDHQAQANQSWKDFRESKVILEQRLSKAMNVIRIGHSLGSKLHLLAPDNGRNSQGLITISFNNFNINQSIPFIARISPRLGIQTEFSPSPNETINIIKQRYSQPSNLLICFKNDNLDQSTSLEESLRNLLNNQTQMITLEGDHLTPVSTGITRNIPGKWNTSRRSRNLITLSEAVINWCDSNLNSQFI